MNMCSFTNNSSFINTALIIERIIIYGACIWGSKLTKQVLTKLTSIQSIFLLQISCGYKTIPTDGLTLLTCIPRNTITLKYEHNRSSILYLEQDDITNTLFPNTMIQHKVRTW